MAQQQQKISKIPETELAGNLVTLEDICKNAADGDGHGLDHLKLEDGMIVKPWFLSTDVSIKRKDEIEQAIEDCVYSIEASERLLMRHAAHVYQLNLAQLCQAFKTLFKENATVPNKLVPTIVEKTMHDLCIDTNFALQKISRLAREGEGELDAERRPNEEPLPHGPITALRCYMSDEEGDGEEPPAESTGPSQSAGGNPRG